MNIWSYAYVLRGINPQMAIYFIMTVIHATP